MNSLPCRRIPPQRVATCNGRMTSVQPTDFRADLPQILSHTRNLLRQARNVTAKASNRPVEFAHLLSDELQAHEHLRLFRLRLLLTVASVVSSASASLEPPHV